MRRGEFFWLRLTTASAQYLRLSERFFHYLLNCKAMLKKRKHAFQSHSEDGSSMCAETFAAYELELT